MAHIVASSAAVGAAYKLQPRLTQSLLIPAHVQSSITAGADQQQGAPSHTIATLQPPLHATELASSVRGLNQIEQMPLRKASPRNGTLPNGEPVRSVQRTKTVLGHASMHSVACLPGSGTVLCFDVPRKDLQAFLSTFAVLFISVDCRRYNHGLFGHCRVVEHSHARQGSGAAGTSLASLFRCCDAIYSIPTIAVATFVSARASVYLLHGACGVFWGAVKGTFSLAVRPVPAF